MWKVGDRQADDLGPRSTRIGAINVPIAQIKSLPKLMGETDVLKVLQLLPGVQSGLYVRGGSPDQNLTRWHTGVQYLAFVRLLLSLQGGPRGGTHAALPRRVVRQRKVTSGRGWAYGGEFFIVEENRPHHRLGLPFSDADR